MSDLRAISLDRPWSAAVPAGLKRFETRGWKTQHRGPLAIHATVKPAPVRELDDYWIGKAQTLLGVNSFRDLPGGAIVALTELACCIRTDEFHPGPDEGFWGNYAAKRWAWGLVCIRPLAVPYPLKGHQGIWSIDGKTWDEMEERALDPLEPGTLELAALQQLTRDLIQGTAKPGDPPPVGLINATDAEEMRILHGSDPSMRLGVINATSAGAPPA